MWSLIYVQVTRVTDKSNSSNEADVAKKKNTGDVAKKGGAGAVDTKGGVIAVDKKGGASAAVKKKNTAGDVVQKRGAGDVDKKEADAVQIWTNTQKRQNIIFQGRVKIQTNGVTIITPLIDEYLLHYHNYVL